VTTPTAQRVAVVTGANRGLGLAIATGLARRGLHVVLTARRLPDAEAAAGPLRDEGLLVQVGELDVTDPISVFRLFADVGRDLGRLDVLVNNAGVAIDRNRRPSAHDVGKIRSTLDANLLGPWQCCMEAVPLMREGGYGRITNVSSRMGSLALMESAGSPAYRVSKAALNALTRVFAAETADENILVNAVSPGTVATRLSYGSAKQTPEQAAEDLLWLSELPDDGPTGGFFHGREHLPW
jgi:NAD(P)-dependent dehydrogenase (short-subunit alcohol dehydrogenase family)